MGGKDGNFKVVYRGEELEHFREGEWVFFLRYPLSASTKSGAVVKSQRKYLMSIVML